MNLGLSEAAIGGPHGTLKELVKLSTSTLARNFNFSICFSLPFRRQYRSSPNDVHPPSESVSLISNTGVHSAPSAAQNVRCQMFRAYFALKLPAKYSPIGMCAVLAEVAHRPGNT